MFCINKLCRVLLARPFSISQGFRGNQGSEKLRESNGLFQKIDILNTLVKLFITTIL